jgi:hypothetical protein
MTSILTVPTWRIDVIIPKPIRCTLNCKCAHHLLYKLWTYEQWYRQQSYKKGHKVYYKENENVARLLITSYKYIKKTAKTQKTELSNLSKLWKTCIKFKISLTVVNLKFATKQIKKWGVFNRRNLHIYNKLHIEKQNKFVHKA